MLVSGLLTTERLSRVLDILAALKFNQFTDLAVSLASISLVLGTKHAVLLQLSRLYLTS